MSPSPLNTADAEDSEISDEEDEEDKEEEDCVGLGAASSLDKRGVWMDVKCGLEVPIAEDGVFLGQSSRDAFTSLLDEEINSSGDDDDCWLLKTPSTQAAVSRKDGCHENGRRDEDELWQAINQEAEARVLFTGNASHYEKARKALRGERGKLKPKFSLFPRSLGGERFLHSADGCGMSSEHEELESDDESPKGFKITHDNRNREYSVIEMLEDFQKEKKQRTHIIKTPTDVEPVQGGYIKHSTIEFLDSLLARTSVIKGLSDKHARPEKKPDLLLKRRASTLGDRAFDREDPSESICSASSSDDEVSENNVSPGVPETSGKTMTDRIQEVIGTSVLKDLGMHFVTSKPLEVGLYGKLQRVIQTEKQMETKLLRIMQSIEHPHVSHDSYCFDVNILSRNLEGKLIVCRCSFMGNKLFPGIPKSPESFDRILIFNCRACDDVEIDVGCWIRVHSPWKGVKTARYGDVILCTHFSQIQCGDS